MFFLRTAAADGTEKLPKPVFRLKTAISHSFSHQKLWHKAKANAEFDNTNGMFFLIPVATKRAEK